MMDLFGEVNYLAVVSAAIAGMLVGAVWYSPMMFANAWMAENKFGPKDLADPKKAMAQSFVATLVLAFGMTIIFMVLAPSPAGWVEGVQWGFALAVLIHGMAGFPNYAFENRSLKLFLIHLGHTAVVMMLMGAILAVWK
ncbi:MAG TPA: DUF1761 domain-containing protein [Sphingomonadales bacterium]|nr:DUF1761 domain-containing protein [Sphingomonadales bacterium]